MPIVVAHGGGEVFFGADDAKFLKEADGDGFGEFV